MTRVIVHAGFHKTATSSLQDFLHRNRDALKPYFDYYGRAEFQDAGAKARLYAQKPFPWRRTRFRHSFRRFLAAIPDAKTIVLSRENFSGAMPGHRDIYRRIISDYPRAAIPLAQEIIQELHRRFGPKTKVQFLYTTRAQTDWLYSVYRHLLRSIHLRQDFGAFCTGFSRLPNPETDARTIANTLAPVPVYIARLEDFADQPEGLAAAILDLVDFPDDARDALLPMRHINRGQDADIEHEFLKINRSGQPKSTLKILKDRILEKGLTP